MKIYPNDRETYIHQTIRDGKKTPGVATYDVSAYFDKFVKPPQNTIMNLKEDRYTHIDEIKYLQKQLPSFYEQVPIVSV